MNPDSRRGIAVSFGAAAFLAVDFFVTAVRVPLLWYHPLERRFDFQWLGTGAAMDFYGKLLWCLAGGLLGWAVAWRALGGVADAETRRWELRLIAWLGTLLVLASALHVTQLVQRNPVPLELPR